MSRGRQSRRLCDLVSTLSTRCPHNWRSLIIKGNVSTLAHATRCPRKRDIPLLVNSDEDVLRFSVLLLLRCDCAIEMMMACATWLYC